MDCVCPHCGFNNKRQAVRCECCLAELGSGGGAATAPAATGQPAAPDAREIPLVMPPITPGASEAAASQPLSLGQPPPITPEVTKGSGALIAGLMVVGLIGGVWMTWPQPGQHRLTFAHLAAARRAARSIPARRVARPVASARWRAPAPPSAGARPAAPPAPVPAAPPAAAPPAAATPASRDEQMAEAQYQIAVNLLKRNQIAPARQALQELVQKYPQAKVTRDARYLLLQLPAESGGPLAAARPASPAPALGARAPAARTAAKPPVEPPPEQERAGRVITSEDLAGGRVPIAPRRTPSIPASLQSAQAAPVDSAKAAARDDVRLLAATYGSGQWVIDVEYDLASAHARQVYLGAWMRDETVSRRLGYAAAPMSSGRAAARVVLPGVPPNASNLRIVFFEDKGNLFFTRDFTISK
jgi:hypothetical protein